MPLALLLYPPPMTGIYARRIIVSSPGNNRRVTGCSIIETASNSRIEAISAIFFSTSYCGGVASRYIIVSASDRRKISIDGIHVAAANDAIILGN